MIQRSRRVSPSSKAFFHEVTGAGKSKVRRPFLGLADDEVAQLRRRLELGIERIMRRSS